MSGQDASSKPRSRCENEQRFWLRYDSRHTPRCFFHLENSPEKTSCYMNSISTFYPGFPFATHKDLRIAITTTHEFVLETQRSPCLSDPATIENVYFNCNKPSLAEATITISFKWFVDKIGIYASFFPFPTQSVGYCNGSLGGATWTHTLL